MLPPLSSIKEVTQSAKGIQITEASSTVLPQLFLNSSTTFSNSNRHECFDLTPGDNQSNLSLQEFPKLRYKIGWKGVEFQSSTQTQCITMQSKQKVGNRPLLTRKTTKFSVFSRTPKKRTTSESTEMESSKTHVFRTPPSRKPVYQAMPKFVTSYRISSESLIVKDDQKKYPEVGSSVILSSSDLKTSDSGTTFFDHSREEYSPIVSSIQSSEVLGKHTSSKKKILYELIPELKLKPSGSILLMEYAKAKVSGKLETLTPNTEINEFLINAIHKNTVLKRLFSQENSYPADIRSLVFKGKDADKAELMQAMSADAYSCSDKEWDLFFYTTLRCKYVNLLQEISCSLPEFEFFYKELFLMFITSTNPDPLIKDEINSTTIRKVVADFKTLVNECSNCETIRTRVGQLVRTAEVNPVLRLELINHAPEWLACLCQRLVTKLKTDRDCICSCIVIVITSQEVCWELLSHRYVDIAYDLVKILMKAISVCGDSFPLYYSTIGFILHCCHVLSILDSIIDTAPTILNSRWLRTWPYLVTCALRHWDVKHFKGYNVFQRKLADQLKDAASKFISRKSAKVALQTLSKKFRIDVDLVTVIHN